MVTSGLNEVVDSRSAAEWVLSGTVLMPDIAVGAHRTVKRCYLLRRKAA